MPQVIKDRPPNFAQIAFNFPEAHRPGVIFAYAPYIYAPSGNVPPELVAHEQVHIDRQNQIGVEEWWNRYLADAEFRFKEEVLAHRAEYQYLCQHGSRQLRRRAAKELANRLCSPLYGKMCTKAQAVEIIEAPDYPVEVLCRAS